MKSPDKREIFETMPVIKALLYIVTPTVLGQIVMFFYSKADTWYIGRTNDPCMVGVVSLVGADDYIEKPYDIDILLAKIKGIFKRRYQRSMLSASGVTLNLANKTAEMDGKTVELAAKEFNLLALLIENQGKALKKEYLFSTVWDSDSDSELQTLHVHINRLRQKLGDDPKNAKRLLTVWGVGYKFV